MRTIIVPAGTKAIREGDGFVRTFHRTLEFRGTQEGSEWVFEWLAHWYRVKAADIRVKLN